MKKTFTLAKTALAAITAAVFSLSASAWTGDSWMSQLPDNLYVSQVSIPGTHDSATKDLSEQKYYSQCQTASLTEQLNAGVRAFDLRPGMNNDKEIQLYHGSSKINMTFKEAMQLFCGWLETHKTEFLIIHLYEGGEDPGTITNKNRKKGNAITNDEWTSNVFNDANITKYCKDFKRDLTVKDMRGYMFFIKRYGLQLEQQYAPVTYEWCGEDNWTEQTNGKLETPYASASALFHVQDLANTTPANKKTMVEKMLSHSVKLNGTSYFSNIFVFNFCSAYNGDPSHAADYADNATVTNKAVIDFLSTNQGPTGILFADYLVYDTPSVVTSITNGTSTKTTYGAQFIKAVIDNNFKYADKYSKINAVQAPTFEAVTLPSGASKSTYRGNTVMLDVDGDGFLDVVAAGRDMSDSWNNKVTLISNFAGGNLSAQQICTSDLNYHRQILPADFNNDGKIDIMMGQGNESKMYINSGNNTFYQPEGWTLYGQEINRGSDDNAERQRDGLMVYIDVNSDGRLDIVTYDRSTNPVPTVFESQFSTSSDVVKCANYGKGACGIPALYDGSMAIGDYTGNGLTDLIVTGKNSSGVRQISICKHKTTYDTGDNGNYGDWGFDVVTPESLQAYATTEGAMKFVDVNNDGLLDLFITGLASDTEHRSNQYTATLLINKGNDTFEKAPTTFPGVAKSSIDWCDLNGDGLADIVYAGEVHGEAVNKVNGQDRALVIAINCGDGYFKIDETQLKGVRSGASVAVADLDKDGNPDISVLGWGDDCFRVLMNKGDGTTVAKAAAKAAAADLSGLTVKLETAEGGDHYKWHDGAWEWVRNMKFSVSGLPAGYRVNYTALREDNGDATNRVYSNVPAQNSTLSTSNVDALATGTEMVKPFPTYRTKFYMADIVAPDKTIATTLLAQDIEVPTSIDATIEDAADADAPVEYYNLQGIRVAEPAKGQIYIVRQGSKVDKVKM